MADLQTVRGYVKDLLKRNYTGVDTTVDFCINSACELIGHTIPSIYEEELWQHTFDASDTAANTDNFALPDKTNFIRTAHLIDTSGDEYLFKPLHIISPDDAYDTDKLEGYRDGSYSFITDAHVLPSTWNLNDFNRGIGRISRVNREGEPEFVYRIAKNVYIQPRSSADIEGWLFRLLLQKFPAELTNNTDTNTITVNYPRSLVHIAAGIMWGSTLGDLQRAQSELGFGAQGLQAVATNDQIGKLINIPLRMVSS